MRQEDEQDYIYMVKLGKIWLGLNKKIIIIITMKIIAKKKV